MSFTDPFKPGAILKLRKKHPCGSEKWRILSIGVFVELECLGCGKKKVFEPIELRRLVRSCEDCQ